MNNATNQPRELARLLKTYWVRWLVPTALAVLASTTYAIVAPKTWQASQAMIVRNEASNSAELGPGKFRSPEDLKAIEDTILELAHSRAVLAAALEKVGPPENSAAATAWPGKKDVDKLNSALKVVPPKGLEFGSTEVFYLEVRDSSTTRVVQLAQAVAQQLQTRLNELRNSKAQSMIDELTRAVQVAKADLQASTNALTGLEKEVGRDLPELRSLLDSNSSDTSLRRTVSEIENELRQVRSSLKTNNELLAVLQGAAAEPTQLLAAPGRLLESQPALRRLKDGLVDAQLATARLQGKDSPLHPHVVAAHEAEQQIIDRLHDEVVVALRGLASEVRLDSERLTLLETQRDQAAGRMNRVAGLRATYANLLTETSNRSKLLEKAEQNLSEARATAASSQSASLLSTIDAPDTGVGPVSPGAATIVLGGLVAGLLIGIGIVFLTVPAAVPASAGVAVAGEQLSSPMPRVAENSLALVAASAPMETVSCESSSVDERSQSDPWKATPIECGQRMNLKQALQHLNRRALLNFEPVGDSAV